MKVLHIIGNASFGGIERLVITLVNEQLRVGAVIPGIMLSSMSGEFLEEFRATGAQLLSSHCKRGIDVSVTKYKSVLNKYADFEVLHFHYFNPFLAWCAVRSGKTIIYTEHGNFGFGRKMTVSDKIKSVLKKKFLNDSVHHVTFNSDFTRQVAENRFGLRKTNRSIVYNGLSLEQVKGDPEHIDPKISKKIERKFIVGTSSRFAGFKRVDRLIEAFSIVQKEKPDMILLLVGDGVMRSQLENQVSELGIAEQVIFAGYRNNVYDYQCVMDVCIFPSVTEPFGLVAVETLLLGKPTLVFEDGGGLKEIVGKVSELDVVDGIDGLCSRLSFYYEHKDMLQEQSNVRIKYARRFDAGMMTEAFQGIYEKNMICVG